MLRQKPKSLCWNPKAQAAFKKLQEAFCTVPILINLDPQLPFLVDVDASTTGVGAVLSQHHGETLRLHPCTSFTRKLSPVEHNDDMGNRELLALEEWWHWLEGTQHPFSVITHHKNLEHLRSVKRLNPRLARWTLFFTWFQFTITYRPEEKHVKADSFSRIHAPKEPSKPEPSHSRQPHPMGSGGTYLCYHPQRACSVGQPQREDLCAHLHAIHTSGLRSRIPRLWTPRQPAHSLPPPSSVLLAQYGLGCLTVCPWMLSLCHLQISPSPTCRKIGSISSRLECSSNIKKLDVFNVYKTF